MGVVLTFGGCVLVSGGGTETPGGQVPDVATGEPDLGVEDAPGLTDTASPVDVPVPGLDGQSETDDGDAGSLDAVSGDEGGLPVDVAIDEAFDSDLGGEADVPSPVDLQEPDAGTCIDLPDALCAPGEMDEESESCGKCGSKSRTRSCTESCEWGHGRIGADAQARASAPRAR